jgi:hypothetical protein
MTLRPIAKRFDCHDGLRVKPAVTDLATESTCHSPVIAGSDPQSMNPVVVKVVVAYLLVNQVISWVKRGSLFLAVVGFRCTSSIVLQLRLAPDQRLGFAWRAAA